MEGLQAVHADRVEAEQGRRSGRGALHPAVVPVDDHNIGQRGEDPLYLPRPVLDLLASLHVLQPQGGQGRHLGQQSLVLCREIALRLVGSPGR